MLSQFILNHRINAVRRNVKVDGNNKEWVNTDHALFVGIVPLEVSGIAPTN